MTGQNGDVSNDASKPDRDPDELLLLVEVEPLLKVGRKTLLRYINEGVRGVGKLRAQKVNTSWRVRQGDVDEFLSRFKTNV